MVENRTGASGMIAAQDVAKADPDGYTLMMGSQTTFAVAPRLYRKVTVDPQKDFAGVALTGASPLVLVVNPSFAAHSVADVITMARTDPGKINFGTGGLGTTPHRTAELFEHDAGIKLVHAAYRGEAGAINDLLVPLMFANLSAVMGNIKGGTIRALAVTSAKRSRDSHRCRIGAARICRRNLVRHRCAGRNAGGHPLEVEAAARESPGRDDTRARFAELGMTTGSSSPDELDAYIKSETAKWSQVITDANIQALD